MSTRASNPPEGLDDLPAAVCTLITEMLLFVRDLEEAYEPGSGPTHPSEDGRDASADTPQKPTRLTSERRLLP
jgi:hypothetical protein